MGSIPAWGTFDKKEFPHYQIIQFFLEKFEVFSIVNSVDFISLYSSKCQEEHVVEKSSNDEIVELLRKLLIVQLGIRGISQKKIREIVKCDMALVSNVMKYLQL